MLLPGATDLVLSKRLLVFCLVCLVQSCLVALCFLGFIHRFYQSILYIFEYIYLSSISFYWETFDLTMAAKKPAMDVPMEQLDMTDCTELSGDETMVCCVFLTFEYKLKNSSLFVHCRKTLPAALAVVPLWILLPGVAHLL